MAQAERSEEPTTVAQIQSDSNAEKSPVLKDEPEANSSPSLDQNLPVKTSDYMDESVKVTEDLIAHGLQFGRSVFLLLKLMVIEALKDSFIRVLGEVLPLLSIIW